ncbi:hypothetical protein KAF25_002538 [Fusarium avenaceum]|uniref:Subtilisin-like serine protease n=1 Tax=Fusarium avenaceum TaxID=40199 RepID=A0A9P7H8C4_9HYPO|nr:hypothetical protein KAF25_002538 [Fusarium avenaceum]
MADDNISVPFAKDEELFHRLTDFVPGQPLISLQDEASISNFLSRELSTERLERMYFMLFLVSNRNNISPLHHQALKGRQILITERPDLHLVWYYDRIFIKPIPLCLLSHEFYKTYILHPEARFGREANGLLRTYASLIVHESDLDVARSTKLLPADVRWENWCCFMQKFGHLTDKEVAARYHYGELRLTRLNFYSKVLFFGWNYFEIHHQYVAYFTRFIAPYLFIFGAITVILAAMQTALTADPEGAIKHTALTFCTFSIVLTAIGLAFFPVLYLFFQMRELVLYIFRHQKPR